MQHVRGSNQVDRMLLKVVVSKQRGTVKYPFHFPVYKHRLHRGYSLHIEITHVFNGLKIDRFQIDLLDRNRRRPAPAKIPFHCTSKQLPAIPESAFLS